MIKIRIEGSREEINGFLEQLEKMEGHTIGEPSRAYKNRNGEQFRVYVEVVPDREKGGQ